MLKQEKNPTACSGSSSRFKHLVKIIQNATKTKGDKSKKGHNNNNVEPEIDSESNDYLQSATIKSRSESKIAKVDIVLDDPISYGDQSENEELYERLSETAFSTANVSSNRELPNVRFVPQRERSRHGADYDHRVPKARSQPQPTSNRSSMKSKSAPLSERNRGKHMTSSSSSKELELKGHGLHRRFVEKDGAGDTREDAGRKTNERGKGEKDLVRTICLLKAIVVESAGLQNCKGCAE